MVNVDQVVRGACGYFENEICRKATGVAKFGAYFMLPMLPQKVNDLMAAYAASPLFSSIFRDGQIDLELARDYAREAMRQCGSLDVMGFRLDSTDVDSLYEYIRRA